MAFYNSPPNTSKVWILSKLNICFSCLPNHGLTFICVSMACLAAMMHYLASTATFWLPPTKILKDAIYDKDAKLTGALHIMEAIIQTLTITLLFSLSLSFLHELLRDQCQLERWHFPASEACCVLVTSSWRRQKTEQEWNQMRRDVHQTTSKLQAQYCS